MKKYKLIGKLFPKFTIVDISSMYPNIEFYDPYKHALFCEGDNCNWNDRDSKQEAVLKNGSLYCPKCGTEVIY